MDSSACGRVWGVESGIIGREIGDQCPKRKERGGDTERKLLDMRWDREGGYRI